MKIVILLCSLVLILVTPNGSKMSTHRHLSKSYHQSPMLDAIYRDHENEIADHGVPPSDHYSPMTDVIYRDHEVEGYGR